MEIFCVKYKKGLRNLGRTLELSLLRRNCRKQKRHNTLSIEKYKCK